MLSRRRFITGTVVVGVGAGTIGAASWVRDKRRYDETVSRLWRLPVEPIATGSTLTRELIRLATLAPSSHNTQCWKFRIAADSITLLPDFSRRCPAVDPDDHHLFVSLGCAAENLVQAAEAHGLHATGRAGAAAADGYTITLERTAPHATALYAAIPERQSTRGPFDSRPLTNAELALLEQAARADTVQLDLITARHPMEQLLGYVVDGNTAQLDDQAFVTELEEWIRFGRDEAVERGDGLYSGSSGNPSIPRWLGRAIFRRVFTAKGENDKYAAQIRSSAGIAVFSTPTGDHANWIAVGRAFERFTLQCAALGIRCAMINPPVEVATLRPQFAAHLGLGTRRPDLVVRFGRGALMPRSLRRPLDAVLV